jgi:hypothetical protein
MMSLPSTGPRILWAGLCPAAAVLLSLSLAWSLPQGFVHHLDQRDDSFLLVFPQTTVFALVPPKVFAHLQTGQTIESLLAQSDQETTSYADAHGEGSFSVPISTQRAFRISFDAQALTLTFSPPQGAPFLFELKAFNLSSPQVRLWKTGDTITAIIAEPARRLLLRFTVPTQAPKPESDVSVIAYLERDHKAHPSNALLEDESARVLYQNLMNLPRIASVDVPSAEQVSLEVSMQVFSTVLKGQVADEALYLEARSSGLDPADWILKDFLRGYIVALHAMLETVKLAAQELSPAERDALMYRARLLASALLMRPYMALSDQGSLQAIDRIIASPGHTSLADLRSLIERHELRAEFAALWNQLSQRLAIPPQK